MSIFGKRPDEQGTSGKFRFSPALITVLVLILTKGKLIFGTLLKMKGLMSFVSMLVSVLTYWWVMNLGLPGALLFVALLFVHEMGHALVLRHYGIPATAPMFIPFLGAFIGIKQMPSSASKEAAFALGGPILGTIGALVCLGVYFATGSNLWLWGATIGFMLNLFNLIPVSPLDGGRIVGATWRGFWFLGLGALAGLAIVQQSGFMALILVFGLDELSRRYTQVTHYVFWAVALVAAALGLAWMDVGFGIAAVFAAFIAWSVMRNPPVIDESKNEEYFAVPMNLRIIIGITYLGMCAGLGALLYYVHTLNVFT